VKVGAANLSQLAIQDRKAISMRVVGMALFIKSEEAEGETEMALEAIAGAAAVACVAGRGYEFNAAALFAAMRALSTSAGLGFAHFGALAGVGKSKRASTVHKLYNLFRLWLIIKEASNDQSFASPQRASPPTRRP
jgi:hypothetical protein